MGSLRAVQSDITKLAVEAVVNAANTSLLGGGGVDGAIHRSAGPELLKACRELHGCAVGDAKLTPGFRLPAKYIIHTVGPVWRGGRESEPDFLRSCYITSLQLAATQGIASIAFPCISTGVYGYPSDLAAGVAVTTTQEWISQNRSLLEIIFCCFSEKDRIIYQELLSQNNAKTQSGL